MKTIDSEVQHPARHTIANQHYQASQPTVQPAPPSGGEIYGSSFENEGSNKFMYTFDRMVTTSPEPDIPMPRHPVVNTAGPSQLSIPQIVPSSSRKETYFKEASSREKILQMFPKGLPWRDKQKILS